MIVLTRRALLAAIAAALPATRAHAAPKRKPTTRPYAKGYLAGGYR